MRFLSSCLCIVMVISACSGSEPVSDTSHKEYYIYVAAESEDLVHRIQFDGEIALIEKTIAVGSFPHEIEGPHGLTVSPDGNYWFVSVAHGQPYGKVAKYTTGSDEKVSEGEAGLFPATMSISSKTGTLFVANFNLHGGMETPGTISVIEPGAMTEIARIDQGMMPHGSRMSPDGTRHYSMSMMTGELVEIDVLLLEVSRRMSMSNASSTTGHESHHGSPEARPTWVALHPTKPLAFVANNGTDEVAVVDLNDWVVVDRYPTDKGPYNIDVSPDGRHMVVTYKSAGTTGIWDLDSGRELARIKNSRRIPHGIVISPDGKYAFVSVEGVGMEPGRVDVISMTDLRLVSSVDVGRQAGGIVFWKMQE